MELNELKEKALLLKEKNTKLHNEVNVKKAEFAQIIRKNFVEIILPYIRDMNGFIENLKFRFNEQSKQLIDTTQMNFGIKLSNWGITIFYKEWKSYGLDTYITYEESYKKLDSDQWLSLAEFFLNL